ncbi:uncharacterized protein [Lolium perenne]|uniref:uncharacterized protein n=1 Tax=Lolium perenne TaxID=4522 RepID=UPI003A9A623E
MPPLRRSASGYRGVRARPSGRSTRRSAPARSGSYSEPSTPRMRRRGPTTPSSAPRPARRQMNFNDVWTREQAEMLSPPSSAITTEQRRRARELKQRLRVAEQDERLHLEWARAFPENVAAMEAFYAQKKEAKAKAAAKKKADRDRRRAESVARKAERAEKISVVQFGWTVSLTCSFHMSNIGPSQLG